MSDKLLEKYFEELRNEIDNENFIKELEESIETISREEIVELIKKHY